MKRTKHRSGSIGRGALAGLAGVTVGMVATLLAIAPGVSGRQAVTTDSGGTLVTLTQADDATCSFDFLSGSFGALDDTRIFLEDTQILYGRYESGMMSVGYVRDELANITDLGFERIEPNYQPTDQAPRTPLSVYRSLFLDGDRIKYRNGAGLPQYHRHAQKALHQFRKDAPLHFEPQLGHTYLMRFRTTPRPSSPTRIVKFQVVDVEPGRYVTIRYAFVN